ncbi:hypothetical protein QFZ22_001182 [Streptomyces canus]|uniref:Uncharacterized protein n=1 Tax=Streptomyces canus TaxID=58343 RepID=A0AAW8F8W1_9ACTN|nr:hypothetical protein [Streptomyces canus]MDQ0905197.1 hypothetical protein [Streptomyces canus]
MQKPERLTDLDVATTTKSVMKKLPEVTLAFWIMKVAATTLGETAGDLFAQTLKLGYFLTTIALFMHFVVTLVVQLRAASHYNPFFYWTVILSTSMAGTDVRLHEPRRQHQVPLRRSHFARLGPAGSAWATPPGRRSSSRSCWSSSPSGRRPG